jgi:hypothetical protein
MKIIFIGSSQSARQSLLDCLPCIGKSKKI